MRFTLFVIALFWCACAFGGHTEQVLQLLESRNVLLDEIAEIERAYQAKYFERMDLKEAPDSPNKRDKLAQLGWEIDDLSGKSKQARTRLESGDREFQALSNRILWEKLSAESEWEHSKAQARSKYDEAKKALAEKAVKEKALKEDKLHLLAANQAYSAALENIPNGVQDFRSAAKLMSQFNEGIKDPGKISKYQCLKIAFDNRRNMAPDSDQRSSGICWAHAASSLLEEQLCLAQPEYCGQLVARSEVAGQTYAHLNQHRLTQNEGGNIASALKYYIDPKGGDQKVCLDKYGQNPYDVGDDRYVETLKGLYNSYKIQPCLGGTGSGLDPEFFRQLISDFTAIQELLHLKEDAWSVSVEGNRPLDKTTFLEILRESNSADEFAQKVLLFYCKGVARERNLHRPGVEMDVVERLVFHSAYDPKQD